MSKPDIDTRELKLTLSFYINQDIAIFLPVTGELLICTSLEMHYKVVVSHVQTLGDSYKVFANVISFLEIFFVFISNAYV